MSTAPKRGHSNPWWIPPFLGRVPEDIEPRLITLLGFVALALFFENYDYSLINSALKHIAIELSIDETELGTFAAWIRLGALPAFFFIPLADYFGRRSIFLIAVAGIGIGTFATAFSQSPQQFIFFQIITRTFMLTASAIAVVIVTEEFPAGHRGWAIGLMTAIASLGHGFGAILFAAIDVLPYGWRALYVVGVGPVLMLPLLGSGIYETQRFLSQKQSRKHTVGAVFAGWFRPMRTIAADQPARAAGIVAAGLFSALGHAVVHSFIGYYVLTAHGWEPWQYSAMVITCGGLGVFGSVAAGRAADRFGRRSVGFVVLALFPLFSWAFFRGPGWSLPPVWILLVFVTMAGNVILRALATELFPTSQRGTASGVLVIAETLGAGAGLMLLGIVTQEKGDLIVMLPWIAAVTGLAAVIVLLFPETGQRELESISEESTTTLPRQDGKETA